MSGSSILLGGVEHHLDNAVDIPIRWSQSPDIEPSRRASEERTCSTSGISPSISLDLSTSWVSVLKTASSRRGKPSAFHPSDEPALPVPHLRQAGLQVRHDPRSIEANSFSRECTKLFSAYSAEIIAVILRKDKMIMSTDRDAVLAKGPVAYRRLGEASRSAHRSIQDVQQQFVREPHRIALHAAGPLRGRDDLGAFAWAKVLRGERRYLQLLASSLDPRQAIPDIGRGVTRENPARPRRSDRATGAPDAGFASG